MSSVREHLVSICCYGKMIYASVIAHARTLMQNRATKQIVVLMEAEYY